MKREHGYEQKGISLFLIGILGCTIIQYYIHEIVSNNQIFNLPLETLLYFARDGDHFQDITHITFLLRPYAQEKRQ